MLTSMYYSLPNQNKAANYWQYLAIKECAMFAGKFYVPHRLAQHQDWKKYVQQQLSLWKETKMITIFFHWRDIDC